MTNATTARNSDDLAGPPPRLAFSIAETCERLGCGESYLREQLRTGRLRSTKVGRRVFITPAAIAAFLDGERHAPEHRRRARKSGGPSLVEQKG